MGQYRLFFAGILLSTLTGVFANWAVNSWYYHAEHPQLEQINKYIPIIGLIIVFLAVLVVFWYIATYVPQL
jgi:hypothetical protein